MKFARHLSRLAVLSLALATTLAHSQDYPNRPIRLIAPIPAGGVTDVMARDMAKRLQDRLGQPVVVENHPGASGTIGTAIAARAPADGYTLLLVNPAHLVAPLLIPNLSYDALKDFSAVTAMYETPMGLFVHPSLPAKTLHEFVSLSNESTPISYATAGHGGPGHLFGEMIARATGAKLTPVAYQGSSPAYRDVLAGHVLATSSDSGAATAPVQRGALRAIAIGASKRLASLPDAPTFAELGYPDLQFAIWIGILARDGTPADIVERLNQEITAIVREPDLQEKYEKQGFSLVANSAEAFGQTMRSDSERWATVVKEANIKVN